MSAPEATLDRPSSRAEAPASGAPPSRRPLLLRDRNIGLIWLGQLLSQVGTRMYQLALAWWLMSQGGGGREVGLFLVAGAVPGLLLVKVSGRAADRRHGPRVLVLSDLAAFLVVAAVGLALRADALSPLGLYVGGFALAATQAFFDPALNKAVGELARPEDVEDAVALQSSTGSIASVAGAAAGALLIDAVGIAGVVALNAASFLVSAATCAMLRYPPKPAAGLPNSPRPGLPIAPARPGTAGLRPASEARHPGAQRPESPLGHGGAPARQAAAEGKAGAPAEEASGWAVLAGRPWIRKAIVAFGLVNFFLSPVLVVLPVYVKATLSGSAALLGALEGVLWLGLVAGTFSAGRVRPGANKAVIASASLVVMAAALAIPGLLPDARVLGALLFALGAALGINNVKFVALLHELVAPELKGRFFAVMQALLSFGYPVAFFLFGQLADRLGPPKTMLVQGAGVLVLAAYFAFLAKADDRPRHAEGAA